MTNNVQDQKIRNTLAEISKTLVAISKAELPMNSLKTLSSTLNEQANNLNTQLNSTTDSSFSYEFYSESSDVVEQITKLRLDDTLIDQVKTVTNLLNSIVSTIREAVFRHKAFTETQLTDDQQTDGKDTLAIAQTKLNNATARATEAAAAAEKANEVGITFIEKFQQLQEQGQEITQELVDQSVEHSITIFAKNAAAVLAADEAACALVNLNEIIEQEKKKFL